MAKSRKASKPDELLLRTPDFIGIGVQRSGSTWLDQQLRAHPDIAMPAGIKEVHYFTERFGLIGPGRGFRDRALKRWMNHERARLPKSKQRVSTLRWIRRGVMDDDRYQALLGLGGPDKMVGEITPAYASLSYAGIEHMLAMRPDVKLIITLRHPIDRAWSGARKKLQKALKEGDLDDRKLRKECFSTGNLLRTAYRDVLVRWSSMVPPEQLHLEFFDNITSEPTAVLERVAAFLEIDAAGFPEQVVRDKVNAAPAVDMPDWIERELALYYESDVRWLVDQFDAAPPSWVTRIETILASS